MVVVGGVVVGASSDGDSDGGGGGGGAVCPSRCRGSSSLHVVVVFKKTLVE